METTTEKAEIRNNVTYERLNQLENDLTALQSKITAMYPDEFEGIESLEKEVIKSINIIWEMRKNYDVKKLMEFKK